MNNRIPALLLACVLLCALLHPIAEETEPLYTMDGYTLILHEGVRAIGRDVEYWLDLEDGEPVPPLISFERGMIPIKRVVFPSTLKYLGAESFYAYSFSSITLPEGLESMDSDSFIFCDIGTIKLPSTYWMSEDGFLSETPISRVEISPAHPYYKTVDGVLYSRDGSSLYYYPSARRDAFFEVPAGVQYINEYAFSGNHYLQGVSLPLGLLGIGRGAFAGCGRLASIAFPLTLKELGDYAFANCVSLQRVSPAPGMALLTSVFENCPLLYGSPDWQGDEGGNEFYAVQYERKLLYFNRFGNNLVHSGEGSVKVLDRPAPEGNVVATLPDWTSVDIGDQLGDWLEISWPVWPMETKDWSSWQVGYVPYSSILPVFASQEDELFTLYSVHPRSPDVPVYVAPFVNKAASDYRQAGTFKNQDFRPEDNRGSIWGDWLVFRYPVVLNEDGEKYYDEETAYASVFDFTFTRMRVGDGLTMCLLLPGDRMEPLLTAPGGETLASLVIGTQAEVLSQGADYTRVRVRGQEGYVRTASVVIVPEENEGGLR